MYHNASRAVSQTDAGEQTVGVNQLAGDRSVRRTARL